MNQTDVPEFENHLLHLGEVFKRNVNDEVVAWYFRALKKYPIKEVIRSMDESLSSEKFFPVPATIIENIQKHHSAHPPQSTNCDLCSGTGFSTVYLRLNIEKLKESGWYGEKLPPASLAIQKGIMEVVSKDDYLKQNGRGYSFAERCQCRETK